MTKLLAEQMLRQGGTALLDTKCYPMGNSTTALHDAVRQGNPAIITVLLRRGASPHVLDDTDESAFAQALASPDRCVCAVAAPARRRAQTARPGCVARRTHVAGGCRGAADVDMHARSLVAALCCHRLTAASSSRPTAPSALAQAGARCDAEHRASARSFDRQHERAGASGMICCGGREYAHAWGLCGFRSGPNVKKQWNCIW